MQGGDVAGVVGSRAADSTSFSGSVVIGRGAESVRLARRRKDAEQALAREMLQLREQVEAALSKTELLFQQFMQHSVPIVDAPDFPHLPRHMPRLQLDSVPRPRHVDGPSALIHRFARSSNNHSRCVSIPDNAGDDDDDLLCRGITPRPSPVSPERRRKSPRHAVVPTQPTQPTQPPAHIRVPATPRSPSPVTASSVQDKAAWAEGKDDVAAGGSDDVRRLVVPPPSELRIVVDGDDEDKNCGKDTIQRGMQQRHRRRRDPEGGDSASQPQRRVDVQQDNGAGAHVFDTDCTDDNVPSTGDAVEDALMKYGLVTHFPALERFAKLRERRQRSRNTPENASDPYDHPHHDHLPHMSPVRSPRVVSPVSPALAWPAPVPRTSPAHTPAPQPVASSLPSQPQTPRPQTPRPQQQPTPSPPHVASSVRHDAISLAIQSVQHESPPINPQFPSKVGFAYDPAAQRDLEREHRAAASSPVLPRVSLDERLALQHRRVVAARRLQRWWRLSIAERDARVWLARANTAAVILQAVYRGSRTRRRVARLRPMLQQRHAAVVHRRHHVLSTVLQTWRDVAARRKRWRRRMKLKRLAWGIEMHRHLGRPFPARTIFSEEGKMVMARKYHQWRILCVTMTRWQLYSAGLAS